MQDFIRIKLKKTQWNRFHSIGQRLIVMPKRGIAEGYYVTEWTDKHKELNMPFNAKIIDIQSVIGSSCPPKLLSRSIGIEFI